LRTIPTGQLFSPTACSPFSFPYPQHWASLSFSFGRISSLGHGTPSRRQACPLVSGPRLHVPSLADQKRRSSPPNTRCFPENDSSNFMAFSGYFQSGHSRLQKSAQFPQSLPSLLPLAVGFLPFNSLPRFIRKPFFLLYRSWPFV